MNKLYRLSLVSRSLPLSATTTASSLSIGAMRVPLASMHAPSYVQHTPFVSQPGFRRSGTQIRHFASSTISSQTTGIIQFKLADVGEGIAECEVLKWYVKVGDKVKEFDPLCEVQSDKATVEITSRYDGVITRLHYNTGTMAKVGSPLVDIDLGGGGAPVTSTVNAPKDEEEVPARESTQEIGENTLQQQLPPSGHVLATPAVRHLAKIKKFNLAAIKGSGRDGRILKEDVLAYERELAEPAKITPVAAVPSSAAGTSSAAKPVFASQQQRTEVQLLSGIRRVMARTMTTATTVPHFGFCDEYVMDELQHLRSTLKVVAEKRGVKLTYMPFFIKAASLALKQYPTCNASINAEMTELTIKHYHNIGVAMDTPHGLVVPNIKDVQDKSVMEIAQELGRLHKAAVNNQLSREDLSGGTFTISNIGTIGGTYASPVLVIPESVIGAIGKIQKLPRYDSKGNVVPVSLLQVSWSADHRVIDGATMANFSNAMKTYVEKPEAMLMDLR